MTTRFQQLAWRNRLCSAAFGLAAVLACGLVAPDGARADVAVVAGKTLSCPNAKVVMSDEVPGPGYSVPGLLMFGPRFLKQYPPLVQRLIFLHECGHQFVGRDETAADCYAVEAGKRQGWLTPATLAQACKAIWHTLSDGLHLAGPERCDALQACYDAAPDPKPH